ncbi:MAG: magnesium transporter CorA family protein, partial [Bifidobacterium adolescentis]
MLRMFRTINGQVEQIQKPENGSWLCLSAPTDVELANVSMETGIDLADLRAPLDDEERSRVDVEDDYTMIIVDIPTVEERGGRDWYETIPLSIIITQSAIITVCMQDTPVLHPFMEGTIRGFNTYMKTRFILQILYRNATMYLRYLRIIDRESDKLELKLRHSMQNREILMLLELSKTLVYFTTSLKSNEIVMEKLTTLPRLKQYPEDEDLLDDVITENKQA